MLEGGSRSLAVLTLKVDHNLLMLDIPGINE
jgi:hypothetical protein